MERNGLKELRKYLGDDLSVHATVWSMQKKLNKKRFENGLSQRSASLSQGCRRTMFSVSSGVSKLVRSETSDIFHKVIQETKKKKQKKVAESETESTSQQPEKSHQAPVRTLPAELMEAISQQPSHATGQHSNRQRLHSSQDFGILVDLINDYVHIRKELATIAKTEKKVQKTTFLHYASLLLLHIYPTRFLIS